MRGLINIFKVIIYVLVIQKRKSRGYECFIEEGFEVDYRQEEVRYVEKRCCLIGQCEVWVFQVCFKDVKISQVKVGSLEGDYFKCLWEFGFESCEFRSKREMCYCVVGG